jgi:hypothetical protein
MVPLAGAQQADEQTGIDQGNYNTKQSIEFGYRFTNVKGSQATSDTMVNLQQGPKLLGFTTEFRSLDHRATFFDNLYLSDPNDVSQIRISKNHCYAFNGMFRKDQKLLGLFFAGESPEPLTPVPNAPVNFNPIINAPPNVLETPLIGTSPHSFYTHRNMQNYNLTILPDSKIRFRLGYDQNTVYGPGGGTIHQGTEQYRLGVDFRLLPRTTISYDQLWSVYKNDMGSNDTNEQDASLRQELEAGSD